MNKDILIWTKENNIRTLVRELENGGVALGTSDTVLGFLAKVSEQGMLALNAIKGRVDKPYIVLIGQKSRVSYFSDNISISAQALIESCWPGPLTLIFKAKIGLPSYAQGLHGTVAIRMPAHEGILTLLQDIPMVFSTSANKAGQPVPSRLEDVDPEIIKQVGAFIMDDVRSHCASITPSTIIDCTGTRLKVVREGAYAIDKLETVAGQKFLRS
jgi:tRNA threonylcarbamoyl adenosine modification protein (Sua5/YciO/YrdC/YwlC family)